MIKFRYWKKRGIVFSLSIILLVVFVSNSLAAGKSKTSRRRFRLTAKAALALNLDNNEVLFEKNSEVVRSIASLTKLMTAMVFLESGTNLFETVKITRKDAYLSAKSGLRVG